MKLTLATHKIKVISQWLAKSFLTIRILNWMLHHICNYMVSDKFSFKGRPFCKCAAFFSAAVLPAWHHRVLNSQQCLWRLLSDRKLWIRPSGVGEQRGVRKIWETIRPPVWACRYEIKALPSGRRITHSNAFSMRHWQTSTNTYREKKISNTRSYLYQHVCNLLISLNLSFGISLCSENLHLQIFL